jgi:F-type H+-transporting ATPase subunit delta
MSVELVARRYAGALADVVEKGSDTKMVQSELKDWEKMMRESGDLISLFKHPAIQYEQKSKVLESLLSKASPGKTAANFLRVLLRNQRLGDLAAINKAFEEELAQRSNEVTAHITTARELSAGEQADLQSNLLKLTGRKVQLQLGVDKELIGGMVTRVGSTVYDSSVKTQLEDLKQQLIKG